MKIHSLLRALEYNLMDIQRSKYYDYDRLKHYLMHTEELIHKTPEELQADIKKLLTPAKKDIQPAQEPTDEISTE